jgi:hypothetical protein
MTPSDRRIAEAPRAWAVYFNDDLIHVSWLHDENAALTDAAKDVEHKDDLNPGYLRQVGYETRRLALVELTTGGSGMTQPTCETCRFWGGPTHIDGDGLRPCFFVRKTGERWRSSKDARCPDHQPTPPNRKRLSDG